MSIFKSFTKDCYPEYEESVVLYNEKKNTYEFITSFELDTTHFLGTGEIREWKGESKSQGDIYFHYPSDVKWAYAKEIVDKFCSRLGITNLRKEDD